MLQKKTKAIAIVLMLAMFLSAAGLNYLPANAADEGEPGAKPIDFTGAYLTTIDNNASTTGDSVVDSSNVPLNPTIKVVFDKNVVNDAVWSDNQQCFTLKTSSGSNVPINVSRISDLVNTNERRNIFISPVNSLSPGTAYKIIISSSLKAKTGVEMGSTLEINFTTIGEVADASAPTWPAGSSLTASGVTQNSLTLNWTAATDNKAVTGYRVYRNGSLLTTVTGTSYNVTGLTAGASYTFKVEAGDAAGNWSTNGPSTTVTTGEAADTAAPTWPAGSSLTASGVTQNSLTLNWTAATDNKAVTGYRVYRNGSLLTTVTGTSYNVTGLSAGTCYTFKVEAGDAAGNWSTSGPSTSVTTSEGGGTVGDKTAPSWQLGSYLKASYITKTGVLLNWNNAKDNVAVTGYRIYRDGVLIGNTNSTWYSVTGLTAGTKYTFKVEAGDAAGNWSTSGPSVSVQTASSQVSQPPVSQPPVVVNTDPANGSYNIQLNKTIVITFNTNVKPGPYFSKITLTDQYGRPVAASNSIAGSTLSIKPLAGLVSGKTYTVSVPTYSVVDFNNRYFTGNCRLRFSTSQQ